MALIAKIVGAIPRLAFPVAAFVAGGVFVSGAASGSFGQIAVGVLLGAAAIFGDKAKV